MPKRAVCAEIGVYEGAFSAMILKHTRPQKLHLIDPWKFEEDAVYEGACYGRARSKNQADMDHRYERVCRRFRRAIGRGIIEVHRASSAAAAARFDDAYFDWIYIDGNHVYEFVKYDLEAFYPKVRDGGMMAGDDYGVEGWWHGGVTKAVDEFVESRRWARVSITGTQFLLEKP